MSERTLRNVACMLVSVAVAVTLSGCAMQHEAAHVQSGHANVRDFGAVGDGHTLNTRAFAAAVAACEQQGGGMVFVPAGKYLTGTIELKNSVHLYLDAGAVLLGSQNSADYPTAENPWSNGRGWSAPLIYAHDAHDVGISGFGKIDGQGARWWKPILDAKARKKPGSQPVAPDNASPAVLPGFARERPQLVRFLRCSDVVISDVTLHNSPEWNIHPLLCERVRVMGVNILTDLPAPNTDGINPESCKSVLISNCRIDTGDDCVTLKSGIDEAGRRMGRPDEDITIENCTMYHGHGGVTIGSEMSGDVRNVVVSNCVFHGTDNGVRIKSQRGRGGIVENVLFNNIVMENVNHAFIITSFYSGKDKATDTYPVSETTPRIRNIAISNVLVRGSTDAGTVTGLREMPLSDIDFSNVHLQSQHDLQITNATDVRFHNCIFETISGKGIQTTNATNIQSDELKTVKSPSEENTK